ncbi:hypothetical protein JOF56_003908 [Kibdelosporangium banguiense]|uniref:Right handed beta helix region n=1 Tax=Kibdelosporangium banguiense TaxID=1365924 RepID=A0ABS4TGH5_9PSEU|nr:hypothetical protein [Kibdelosporangium banguiense]MBP2323523.1 hypothetical protein [Kibdelosporangium banguiense]
MSDHRSRRPARAALVVLVVSAVLGAGLSTAAPAAAGDADIRIVGGDASSAMVCGNVAAAQDLARQRGIAIQRTKCTARAVAGNVVLENVDIYVRSAAPASGDDAVLAAFGTNKAPGVAQANCNDHRPPDPGGRQLNKCWAIAHGGQLLLENVKLVNHHSDGSISSRSVTGMALPAGNGTADAFCANIVSDPLNQRDDCGGTGAGAAWSMRGVDVVIHNPDGTSSTRRGITIEVRGGDANATIHCFNVTDGKGRVIQINVCNADVHGGEATLRNVTIHSTA